MLPKSSANSPMRLLAPVSTPAFASAANCFRRSWLAVDVGRGEVSNFFRRNEPRGLVRVLKTEEPRSNGPLLRFSLDDVEAVRMLPVSGFVLSFLTMMAP